MFIDRNPDINSYFMQLCLLLLQYSWYTHFERTSCDPGLIRAFLCKIYANLMQIVDTNWISHNWMLLYSTIDQIESLSKQIKYINRTYSSFGKVVKFYALCPPPHYVKPFKLWDHVNRNKSNGLHVKQRADENNKNPCSEVDVSKGYSKYRPMYAIYEHVVTGLWS